MSHLSEQTDTAVSRWKIRRQEYVNSNKHQERLTRIKSHKTKEAKRRSFKPRHTLKVQFAYQKSDKNRKKNSQKCHSKLKIAPSLQKITEKYPPDLLLFNRIAAFNDVSIVWRKSPTSRCNQCLSQLTTWIDYHTTVRVSSKSVEMTSKRALHTRLAHSHITNLLNFQESSLQKAIQKHRSHQG